MIALAILAAVALLVVALWPGHLTLAEEEQLLRNFDRERDLR